MLRLRYRFDDADVRRTLEEAPARLNAALGRAVDLGLAIFERAVKRNIAAPFEGRPPAVAYGFLVNSVHGEARPRPELGGLVAAHPPAELYAAHVEFGTRAHFPPPQALWRWVAKKFGLRTEKEIEEAAFRVARGIAKKGTPAHRMFARAFQGEQGAVELVFDAEIARELEAL